MPDVNTNPLASTTLLKIAEGSCRVIVISLSRFVMIWRRGLNNTPSAAGIARIVVAGGDASALPKRNVTTSPHALRSQRRDKLFNFG